MHDIVIPNNNETEFIALAKRLGIKKLTFAYTAKRPISSDQTDITIEHAILAETNQISKTKQAKLLTISIASREAIERGADIVYGFEQQPTKDHTHFRSSGLNQVLCKLAQQNNTKIAFLLSNILAVTGPQQAILLGRIMQNIAFCTKYKTKMKIATFATNPMQLRAPQELTALFITLGMQESEIREAID